MVAVRIPGADNIQDVAVARDPGVRASPEDFGAQIGEGMQHLGNAAVEVGALMDRKREAAAAAMALPEASARFQLEATNKQQELSKKTPTSAAGYGQEYNDTLQPTQDQIIAETKQKYNLSDLNAAKLAGHLTTIRGHAVVNGVTNANNQIVRGLLTSHDNTVQTISSAALATGDVDGGLKQVDDSVNALKGIIPDDQLSAQATKSKKVVVDAAIASAVSSQDFKRADELTQRFYGSVPEPAGSKLPGSVGAIVDQAARAAGVDPALARRIAQIESGGNPSASTGKYRGLFQLSDEGFAANGGKGSITDPVENAKAGVASLKNDIEAFRAKYGREPSATEIYLSHQQGQGGLAAHLANPGAPAWQNMASTAEGRQKGEAWAKQAIWGNIPDSQKAQFGSVENVSSQAFFNVWKQKVEGGAGTKPELPDAGQALKWSQAVNQKRTQVLSTASAETENQFTRQIIDANAGIGALPSRSAIESNTNIGDDIRNKLLAQYDSAASDVIKLQGAMKKFTDPNGGSFNPYDKDDKANIDRIYNSLGGDIKALEIVSNRTGMVPEAAVTGLRGAMVSSDPAKVEQALQVSANLIGGKYPDVFANVKGGDDLTKTANTFRHYVYDRGMTATDATAKIIEERTPEYEQRVKARIKSEDVNDIVKKQLKDSDIRHAFDDSWIPFNDPKLTFNPEMRQRAMGDYEEAFRENFAKNGDVSLSKTLALDEMKRTWGTTQVNGAKTVMKYPPERSPVYAGIENPSEHIAQQAVSAIKDLNGKDIDRSKIRLDEIKNTAERYVRGQPPVYVLSYVDDKGHVQTIPKQFYADPTAMRDKQTAARAAQSAKIQTRVDIDADNADLSRANFGVQ